MPVRGSVRVFGVALVTVSALIAAHVLPLARTAVAQVTEPSCAAQSDPNTPIMANTGDEFAIGLPSNKTTGYSWQLDAPPDDSVAYLDTSIYVSPAPPSGPPVAGAGGRECWVFYAAGPGQTTLTLNYLRPFDPPGTAPAMSLTFTVVVK